MVPSRVTCFVESMESRALMSAAPGQGVPLFDSDLPLAEPPPPLVTLEQGVLTITGTDGNDQINVGVAARRSDQVHWRGRWRVTERSRVRYCQVQVNGEVRRFKASKIRSVMVHAGAGDDTVVLGRNLEPHVPDPEFPGFVPLLPLEADAAVHGGDGADFIVGGNGNDRLDGEGGDDRMFGLRGRDTVDGGDGNDVLGDACEDRSLSIMLGGPGDDVLVGDPTYFVPPEYSLAAQSVPHSLIGGAGNDQFRAHPGEVRDLEPGESLSPAVCDRAV